MTGLAVDDDGNISALETEGWLERRERLRQFGGPPEADSGWLFDPILYGPDPTACARAWIERRCWVEAEAAFAEVLRVRPLRPADWMERGRFYAMRSEPAKAAADFVQALSLGDRDPRLPADIVSTDNMLGIALTLLPPEAAGLSAGLLFLRAQYLAKEGRLDLGNVLLRADSLPWEEDQFARWRLRSLQADPIRMLVLLGCPDRASRHLADSVPAGFRPNPGKLCGLALRSGTRCIHRH